MKLKPLKIDSHRNGVAGNSFYVVIFRDNDGAKMIATVFPEPGNIAVYDLRLLGQENIMFGENSWFGDRYEKDVRQWIEEKYGKED